MGSPVPSAVRVVSGDVRSKPPTPDPITVKPGKTAKVKLAFDDSNKVP
jgi:hypothetical protein